MSDIPNKIWVDLETMAEMDTLVTEKQYSALTDTPYYHIPDELIERGIAIAKSTPNMLYPPGSYEVFLRDLLAIIDREG